MNETETQRPTYGPVFWVGLVAGWSVIGFAIVGILNSVWLKDRPGKVVVWVLGGLVVHDLLLASSVTVVGLVLAKLLPRWMRGPVSGALALSGLILLFSYPLLRAFGRRDSNPSILPLDYGRNVVVVLALIWFVTAVVLFLRLLREERS